MHTSPLLRQDIEPTDAFVIPARMQTEAGPQETSRLIKGDRRLVIYPADSGFDILEDIDRVTDYALEPNIFFAPRFLVPAMPRVDNRDVRLLLLQDGTEADAETRLLMPFSVEKSGFRIGPEVMRVWANEFGPSGVPIVERRESSRIIDDLLATLADPGLALPKILVLPDVMMDSAVIRTLRGVAIGRGLPVLTTGSVQRPFLQSELDSIDYLNANISKRSLRNFRRLRRHLEEMGRFEYEIARSPRDVRIAMEEFLLLENAGWKGRQRTSLAADRYRAAFAREAVNNLAERDLVRIHAFKLDGRVIASLIVFVQAGHAWTWKTTYDESLAQYSPGTLLIMQSTEVHLEDPNIQVTDSCAVEDHPVVGRLWSERREFATMVIGLRPELDREARQIVQQMELYRSTRNAAKTVRDRLKQAVKRR
ncbi:GNAT family N-acetyltransferase [Oricola thermophila]|uniref:GNAT family N-acetyltransferase n=1 Tax=Oricola thermophila TaxID=2742145 RepID=A0A6N1VH46_9HYPH|nr:GNAT family N-acetyltransferase [Oricola thermophila]QKV20220.1 GNAT family N-acetyltransferase [Oricola thermophila]